MLVACTTDTGESQPDTDSNNDQKNGTIIFTGGTTYFREGQAVSVVKETLARFPEFRACSFDKGYHSPANQKNLRELLEHVVLPKKGRRNKAEQERESTPEFQAMRCQHSAIESAINALEVHGLDRCPDHGIRGFKRYVALAVVARNIQKLGAELRKQEQAEEKRKKDKLKRAA